MDIAGVHAHEHVQRPESEEGGKGGHAWNNPTYNNDYQSSVAGSPGGAILRFPDNINYTATGSPTETTDGSFKILQWPRTAGTYTITFT